MQINIFQKHISLKTCKYSLYITIKYRSVKVRQQKNEKCVHRPTVLSRG